MTDVTRSKRDQQAREKLVKVREDIARAVILPELSRALIAQVALADRLIARGEYVEAKAVVRAIEAASVAAFGDAS